MHVKGVVLAKRASYLANKLSNKEVSAVMVIVPAWGWRSSNLFRILKIATKKLFLKYLI